MNGCRGKSFAVLCCLGLFASLTGFLDLWENAVIPALMHRDLRGALVVWGYLKAPKFERRTFERRFRGRVTTLL